MTDRVQEYLDLRNNAINADWEPYGAWDDVLVTIWSESSPTERAVIFKEVSHLNSLRAEAPS